MPEWLLDFVWGWSHFFTAVAYLPVIPIGIWGVWSSVRRLRGATPIAALFSVFVSLCGFHHWTMFHAYATGAYHRPTLLQVVTVSSMALVSMLTALVLFLFMGIAAGGGDDD